MLELLLFWDFFFLNIFSLWPSLPGYGGWWSSPLATRHLANALPGVFPTNKGSLTCERNPGFTLELPMLNGTRMSSRGDLQTETWSQISHDKKGNSLAWRRASPVTCKSLRSGSLAEERSRHAMLPVILYSSLLGHRGVVANATPEMWNLARRESCCILTIIGSVPLHSRKPWLPYATERREGSEQESRNPYKEGWERKGQGRQGGRCLYSAHQEPRGEMEEERWVPILQTLVDQQRMLMTNIASCPVCSCPLWQLCYVHLLRAQQKLPLF